MIPRWAGRQTPNTLLIASLSFYLIWSLQAVSILRLEVKQKGITNGDILPVLCQVLPHCPQQVPVFLGISKVLLIVCRLQDQVGHINNPNNPTTCPVGKKKTQPCHSTGQSPPTICLGLGSSPVLVLTCLLPAVGPLSHTSWSGDYSCRWTCRPGPDVQCWPQKQNSVP